MDYEVRMRHGEGIILVSDTEEIIIRLRNPKDEAHAEKVLAFLKEHVEAIIFDPERTPPAMMMG